MKKPTLTYSREGKKIVENRMTYSQLKTVLKYVIQVADKGVLIIRRTLKCGTKIKETWQLKDKVIEITEREI